MHFILGAAMSSNIHVKRSKVIDSFEDETDDITNGTHETAGNAKLKPI